MNIESKATPKYGRSTVIFFIGIITLAVIFIMNIAMGSSSISLGDVFGAFTDSEETSDIIKSIVLNIRLPRTLATVIGGACLATAGVLLQIFFSNPIVEPYILGISSGSSLFVGLVMLAGMRFGMQSISSIGMFIGSFIGAMTVMVLVIFASQKVRSITTLLIIGMMFGYICGAATTLMAALADKERLANYTLWTMGSFSGFLWRDIYILYVVGVPVLVLAFLISKPLNTMLLGEKYAESMGISIKPFRFLLILIASILTSVVTAFAGPISFIGLAVPHLARILFKTSDNRIIIPAACCFGAIMTGLCDLGARMLLAPLDIPLGAMTSIIGAPLLVYLLLSKKGGEL